MREHLKHSIVALDKALKYVESSYWACFSARDLVVGVVSNGLRRLLPKSVGVWPYLDPSDSLCLRTAPVERNVPGKHGPHGELFLLDQGAGDDAG